MKYIDRIYSYVFVYIIFIIHSNLKNTNSFKEINKKELSLFLTLLIT